MNHLWLLGFLHKFVWSSPQTQDTYLFLHLYINISCIVVLLLHCLFISWHLIVLWLELIVNVCVSKSWSSSRNIDAQVCYVCVVPTADMLPITNHGPLLTPLLFWGLQYLVEKQTSAGKEDDINYLGLHNPPTVLVEDFTKLFRRNLTSQRCECVDRVSLWHACACKYARHVIKGFSSFLLSYTLSITHGSSWSDQSACSVLNPTSRL